MTRHVNRRPVIMTTIVDRICEAAQIDRGTLYANAKILREQPPSRLFEKGNEDKNPATSSHKMEQPDQDRTILFQFEIVKTNPHGDKPSAEPSQVTKS